MKKNVISPKSKLLLSIFLGSIITTSLVTEVQAADLGSVSVLKDVKPANPGSKDVWNAHWKDAYNNCHNTYPTTKSVNLESFDVTAGGRHNDSSTINSVWICRDT